MTTEQGSFPMPPVRPARQRFHCRVSIENITINVDSVEGGNSKTLWEQLRLNIWFNGVVQRTRWLAVPLAMAKARQEKGKKQISTEEGKKEEESLAEKIADRITPLPFTSLNDCSFVVEFQTEGVDDSSPHTNIVRQKRVHLLQLNVDANNDNRIFSTTGGTNGESKATSSNAEALGAAYHKSTAKLSAFARSAFRRLGNGSESRKEKDNAAQKAAFVQFAKSETKAPEKLLPKGVYKTVISGIDLSEAYNAPGGRKQFHLVLQRESNSMPLSGEGVPVLVGFTVVVHYEEPKPILKPRYFHDFAIVVDQIVLNLSEAKREAPPEKQSAQEAPRPITGYGFGLTSNTFHKSDCVARSVIVPTDQVVSHDGSSVSVIDFSSLHGKDERQLTKEDYERLPTSCCIVSTGCRSANRERVGSRVVCLSRFKTSPDGLCKASLKCQLTFSLFRKFENGGVEEEAMSSAAISLANILNDEEYPQRIREVTFSLGEILYFRIQRYCFVNAEKNGAPLLMPYDYDNSGVEIAEKVESIASWKLPKKGTPSNSESETDSATDTNENTQQKQAAPQPMGNDTERRPPNTLQDPPSENVPLDGNTEVSLSLSEQDTTEAVEPLPLEVEPTEPSFSNPFDENKEQSGFTLEMKGDAFHYDPMEPEESTADKPSFEITGTNPFLFSDPSSQDRTQQTPVEEAGYVFGEEKEADNPKFEISNMPGEENPFKFD